VSERRWHALGTAALLCLVPAASGTRMKAGAEQGPASCPGARIAPDRVVTGSFGTELQGSYVLVPFEVPRGTTAVRVKYCFDQPPSPSSSQVRHTLDLGLYQPPARRGALWGREEFRGWGGSSHPDVTVSPQGFSTEAQYLAEPRGHVPGRTTRGFRPGPIPPGTWAAELGVAAVVPRSEGDDDGRVAWRVEIELSRDPSHAGQPYRPARYDRRPARAQPGWYAGDFHVHAEHSALGDATMTETFQYAFRPLSQGGAGLDFVNLSDYVTDTGWGEIGRHQGAHPGKLVLRSSEVITYRGHLHNNASGRYVDYRTGPVHERRADGSLALRRGPRPPRQLMDEVHRAGGFTQINHPTIFPSSVPTFAQLCRGCPWDYSPDETAYAQVDGIEVATGPAGFNTGPGQPGTSPFVLTAIEFYEAALSRGHHVAALGSSDSHNAGRTPNPVTQTPIGEATTVVYADELSERGIQRGVERGHTYVKLFGNAGPDLRFEATVPGTDRPTAIMGETVDAERADLVARVTGAQAGVHQLLLVRDGQTIRSDPVTGPDFTMRYPGQGPGRYRLHLQRNSAVEALTTPIWVGPRQPLTVVPLVAPRNNAAGGRLLAGCRAGGTDVRDCTARVLHGRGGATRTIAEGRAPVTAGRAVMPVRLNGAGSSLLRRLRGQAPVTVIVAAVDREGRRVEAVRQARLVPARR
jgi:hypothetical protein